MNLLLLLAFWVAHSSATFCSYSQECGANQMCSFHTCQCQPGYHMNITTCIKDCRHGSWNASLQTCQCDPEYREAGITNTLAFLEGKCSQFQCQSDAQCQERTGFHSATCPVKGWDCYCGMSHAGRDFPNATCMGVVYSYSFATLDAYLYLIQNIFHPLLYLVAACLGFGTRRVRCDHQTRYFEVYFDHCNNRQQPCRGECLTDGKIRWRDEFSMSWYCLNTLAWWLAFLTFIELVNVFIWSFILWTIIVVGLILVVVLAICGKCQDEYGGDADCQCCLCPSGDCCCTYTNHSGNQVDIFIVGGPQPEPCCLGCCDDSGSTSTNETCCCQGCCQACLNCIRWFIYSYPRLPDNLHGGLVGYILGTHSRRSTPFPQNILTEFLSLAWLPRRTLKNNENWHRQVKTALHENSPLRESPPQTQTMERSRAIRAPTTITNPISGYQDNGSCRRSTSLDSVELSSLESSNTESLTDEIMHVRDVVVVSHQREWSAQQDGAINCQKDYIEKQCWICQDADRPQESGQATWDVWWTCRHAFCTECSQTMLERGWSCPLCRQKSHLIKRFQR